MEGKNILYICDYAAPYTGSFILALTELAKEAGKQNQIYFLFPENAKNKEWVATLPGDRENIFFADFSPKSLAQECRRLSKLLNRETTVVHTHFVGDFRLLAVRSAFANVICHYHMMVPMGPGLMKKLKRLVRRVIYRGIIIVGVSEAVTEDAEGYFYKVRCECIPNAVDFSRLENCTAKPAAPEKTEQGQFRILAHGTDFVCKGMDVAIKAVNELNREYDNGFRLYMTSNTVAVTEKKVLEITEEIENITVMQSVENIKSLYDSMDLYISPSREEAFGYAVVEAAYANCQVAASDIPGQNTMKQVPGILWFGKDDVEGLKKMILQARENKANGTAAEMKERQKAYVTQAFRIDEWVRRNLDVYKKYFGEN